MLTLGIPVVNQHFLTKQCINSLSHKKSRIVVIDNNSQIPYQKSELGVDVIRNNENKGYYYPLLQLYEKFPDAEYIGLMHNDLFLQEEWEDRIIKRFESNPHIGVVGIAGSMEVDSKGSRGRGILCNLGDTMPPDATRMTEFSPALLLDGIFMIFRRKTIPMLKIDKNIPLFNFMDRMWFLRLYRYEWLSAIEGIKAEHFGGMTEIGDVQYAKDAEEWLKKRNLYVEGEQAPTTMFKIAEKMYLDEHLGGLIPSRIDNKWHQIKYQ